MRNRESGQLMILVAFGMVALIGCAALAVDLGYGLSGKRLAQNGADAAAMSGIRMVRKYGSTTTASAIHSEMVRVAALNGNSQVASDEFLGVNKNSLGQITSYAGSLDDVAGVRVRTQKVQNTFFGSFLGVSTMSPAGKATAMSLVIAAESGTDLRPMAVLEHPNNDPTQDYEVGTVYTIWDSVKETPGNAGWLDLDGGANGAKDLKDWITNGFNSTDTNRFYYYDDEYGPVSGDTGHWDKVLPFPCWVQGDPGIKTSAEAAVDALVNRSITIVTYSHLTGTGAGARYRVVGLAQFVVTSVEASTESKQIKGRFERMVLPGDPGSEITTSLVSTARLVSD